MVWVNIDKPTKKCTIHFGNCTYVKNKKETKLKGIEELKSDGGWLSFDTIAKARHYCSSNFANYVISQHC